MSNIQDAVNKVNDLNTAVSELSTSLTALIDAMTRAFVTLEQKIAAGSETQPIIDSLSLVGGQLTDLKQKIDNATAAANIEATA